MTQFASPVLHSLLDTDAYKLHMQQAVFHHYYDVHVAAEFRCRGDDLLGIYADAIREQIQAMQHLRLQDDEYQCGRIHGSGVYPCLCQSVGIDYFQKTKDKPNSVSYRNHIERTSPLDVFGIRGMQYHAK